MSIVALVPVEYDLSELGDPLGDMPLGIPYYAVVQGTKIYRTEDLPMEKGESIWGPGTGHPLAATLKRSKRVVGWITFGKYEEYGWSATFWVDGLSTSVCSSDPFTPMTFQEAAASLDERLGRVAVACRALGLWHN